MSRLRSVAPVFIKRLVWNLKHRNSGTDPAKCPHDLLEYFRLLDPTSAVLDLGCGHGNLRAALRSRGWIGHFIGVDVSDLAIQTARKSKDDNAEWHVSPIETFPIPEQKVGAICLCESLYYVNLSLVPALLERCRQSLVSGGRIIIRVWSVDRHREYLALLSSVGAQVNPPIYILTTVDA